MTTERDILNQIAYARKEGAKKGYEEGVMDGIEKGIEKGKAEGRATGGKERAMAIATSMKQNAIPVDVIVKCTGLGEAEVEAL